MLVKRIPIVCVVLSWTSSRSVLPRSIEPDALSSASLLPLFTRISTTPPELLLDEDDELEDDEEEEEEELLDELELLEELEEELEDELEEPPPPREYSIKSFGALLLLPLYESATRLPLPVIINAREFPLDQPPRSTTSWMTEVRSGVRWSAPAAPTEFHAGGFQLTEA